MNKKIIRTLLICFVFININLFSETLELKLKKDEVYKQKVSAISEIIQDFGFGNMSTVMTIGGLADFKVINDVNGIYEMEVSYESLSLKMNFLGTEFEFNSDKVDVPNSPSTLFKNMTGKVFNLKMTKLGKVVEVYNTDVLYKDIFNGIENVSEEEKEQVKAMLEKSFGGE